MPAFKKPTAYKLNISDLLTNPYIKTDGQYEPNFIDLSKKLKAEKVRILATVTFKFLSDDGNYASITLDDGTGSVRVKAWQEIKLIKETEKGNTVDIIAKVREWNGEVYLVPEILRKVDNPDLETLRRLEIIKFKKDMGLPLKTQESKEQIPQMTESKEQKEPTEPTEQEKSEPESEPDDNKKTQDLRVKVLKVIDSLDNGDGTAIDDIIESVDGNDTQIEETINDLLAEGTCYEPRAGRIKVL